MKKPEIIKAEIEELKKQLKESEKFYRYIPIENFISNGKDVVGGFDFIKSRKIMEMLADGSLLLYSHEVFGMYEVKMNPQQNRILVNPIKAEHHVREDKTHYVREDNIMGHIGFGFGKWYLDNDGL